MSIQNIKDKKNAKHFIHSNISSIAHSLYQIRRCRRRSPAVDQQDTRRARLQIRHNTIVTDEPGAIQSLHDKSGSVEVLRRYLMVINRRNNNWLEVGNGLPEYSK